MPRVTDAVIGGLRILHQSQASHMAATGPWPAM